MKQWDLAHMWFLARYHLKHIHSLPKEMHRRIYQGDRGVMAPPVAEMCPT